MNLHGTSPWYPGPNGAEQYWARHVYGRHFAGVGLPGVGASPKQAR